MSQPRHMSFVESMTNIAVGYTVSILTNFIVLPMFGYEVTLKKNLLMGLCFTVISLTRSYVLRRCFNRLGESKAS